MIRNTSSDPMNYGIFAGLKIAYPEFTVLTPQTGLEYNVRALNVSEISKLKSSITTPAKSIELVNQTIWGAITSKPDFVTNYEDFCRITTLRDREALLHGIFIISFGSERELEAVCTNINCGATRTIKVNLNDVFSINMYPGALSVKKTYKFLRAAYPNEMPVDPEVEKELEKEKKQQLKQKSKSKEEQEFEALGSTPLEDEDTKRALEVAQTNSAEKKLTLEEFIKSSIISVEIPVLLDLKLEGSDSKTKVYCIIHQHTIKDEREALGNLTFTQRSQLELITETLIVKRFELRDQNENILKTINQRDEITYLYQQLPVPAKRKIEEEFRKNFQDYGISLKTKWTCLSCGLENELNIDIATQFFRMVVIS